MSTRHQGAGQGPRRALVDCTHLVSWLELSFGRKEANFWKKHRVKISAQSELRISGNIRNGFRPENRNAKQKRTEREIQSRRGSCPSAAMEAMDQRGNSPPIYGGGQGRIRRSGALSPSLPVAPECCRGNHRDDDLHQQLRRRQYQLSPPLCSGVTPLLPTVIST